MPPAIEEVVEVKGVGFVGPEELEDEADQEGPAAGVLVVEEPVDEILAVLEGAVVRHPRLAGVGDVLPHVGVDVLVVVDPVDLRGGQGDQKKAGDQDQQELDPRPVQAVPQGQGTLPFAIVSAGAGASPSPRAGEGRGEGKAVNSSRKAAAMSRRQRATPMTISRKSAQRKRENHLREEDLDIRLCPGADDNEQKPRQEQIEDHGRRDEIPTLSEFPYACFQRAHPP